MKAIFVFIYIVTLGISLVLGVDVNAGTATFANKRAILDGDIGLWTNKEEIDRRLQRIKEAGFNAASRDVGGQPFKIAEGRKADDGKFRQ